MELLMSLVNPWFGAWSRRSTGYASIASPWSSHPHPHRLSIQPQAPPAIRPLFMTIVTASGSPRHEDRVRSTGSPGSPPVPQASDRVCPDRCRPSGTEAHSSTARARRRGRTSSLGWRLVPAERGFSCRPRAAAPRLLVVLDSTPHLARRIVLADRDGDGTITDRASPTKKALRNWSMTDLPAKR